MGNKHSHGVGTDTERRRRRRSTPLNGQDSSLFPLSEDLLQRAETGVFSDSESEQSIESESDSDISDTQSDDGVWMVLPSALNPTGTTIRKVATQVLDQEEQLQLVKRRVQATRSQPVQINYQDKSRGSSGNVDVSTQDAVDDEAISPTNFQRIKVIGVGGMGRVLLVRYRRDGKLYAMKVVSKRSVRKKDMAARVLSERDVLGGTCHHALVNLYWAFQSKSNLYFVMEYCPGGELSTHLERETTFTEDVAAFYSAELVLAVQQLHQHGIIHRDIKPENLLLTEDGHLKLVDFGISKFGITEATRGAKTICGSYEYLAPEILQGREYGTAADWWAFGAVLYELLTGLPPWYSENLDEMRTSVLHTPLSFPAFMSVEAKDLLGKLLNQNPVDRLGSRAGSSEVKEHAFFRHIDWEMVTFREVQAPIQPCLVPDTIINGSNFRSEFTRISLGSFDSSSGGSFSESFRGFNFAAPKNQHIEYGYARDASLHGNS